MNRYQRIEAEALRILREADALAAPVDLEKVAKHLGIQVHNSEQMEDEVSGMLIIKGNGKHVVLNPNHHENRQRFTFAHEIGHLTLHHKDGDQLFVDKKFAIYTRQTTKTGEMEREANVFAAAFLMPEELVRFYVEIIGYDVTDELDILKLATDFGVSEQAMVYRLRNLQLIRQ